MHYQQIMLIDIPMRIGSTPPLLLTYLDFGSEECTGYWKPDDQGELVARRRLKEVQMNPLMYQLVLSF